MNAIEKLLTIKQNWTGSRKPIPDEWIAEWQENPTVGLVRTATAELAAQAAQIAALNKALDYFEWDETTGECIMGCGGCASDGHNVGCQYVEKLVELGLMKIEKESEKP
jgi:hypothetical protein